MGWKGKFVLNLVLGISTVIGTQSAFAEKTLRIVIEQDKPNAQIPVSSICPSIAKEFIIEKVGDEVGFADKKQPEKQTIKNGILPKFDLKEIFAEGVFQVSALNDGKQSCYFTVNAIPSGRINESLQKLEGSGKKAITSGKGWLLLEETPPSPEDSKGISSRIPTAAQATSPDSGTITRIYEDSMFSVFPKAGNWCARPYDPVGLTRYSSGIVTWNRDNPARNGYSIKDENSNSEYVRTLRCPKGANLSEHRVDGIYKTLWDLLYGARAIKVPDHCTAYALIDSNNKRYWDCCCNAAGSAAASALGKDTFCKVVDPRFDPRPDVYGNNGWPNAATRRCS
jgi:hypothetical protein